MIFIISLAKIIFYASIGGIIFLVAKKFFEQKQERERLIFLLKDIFAKLKIFGTGFFLKARRLVNFLAPKIKNSVIILVKKLAQAALVIKNFLLERASRWKKELKPMHLPKEKKEFLSHLWEKINKTKAAPVSKEPSKEFQSAFRPTLTKVTVKPAVPNVSVVDDPIKREILMKQEQSLLKLIVSRPKDFNLYKKLGIIYKELGSFEDAKNCFEYALKLGSKDRDIVRELEALK